MQVYKNGLLWFNEDLTYEQVIADPRVQQFNQECQSSDKLMSAWKNDSGMYLQEI